MNNKHFVRIKSKTFRFNPLGYFGLIILSFFAVLTLTNPVQPVAASAGAVMPAAETKCKINAYVFDIYPNGINVRSGAGKNFDILGQIKPDENGVIVEVNGSNGNWLKIDNAQRIEGESPFSGSGWVFSSQLAMSTRMKTKLYSRPNAKSKVLAKLPAEEEVTLVACKGDWAQVRYGADQGWLERDAQCGNPVTSCS